MQLLMYDRGDRGGAARFFLRKEKTERGASARFWMQKTGAHRMELRGEIYASAMASISTSAPFGRRATSTALRAGGSPSKKAA